MMSAGMKIKLKQAVEEALTALKQQAILPEELNFAVEIERTRDPTHGDFACNSALMLAKPCQLNPCDLAEKIISKLPALPEVQSTAIAGPGFINFTIRADYYLNIINTILQTGQEYGRLSLGKGQRVHIEIVSANPTGPLHVGHGRIAAYGASLADILEAAGFLVHREYCVNDAGRQMRILATSVWLRYLESYGEEAAFPRSGYKGDYIRAIAKDLKVQYEDKFYFPASQVFKDLPLDDEEQKELYVDALVARALELLGEEHFARIFQRALQDILQDIRDDLKEFGVTCQNWFHESQLAETADVERGIRKLEEGGYLYQREGAIWFRSSDFGDEKDRVVIRENGQPTYFAFDIGYHLNKFERGFDRLLDVYGADHHGYIPRLKALIIALGQDVTKLEVLLVQFAILFRGKTRVSMSTRGGEFVTLRELREEVGRDAARFFYIMRKHDQHLEFDLELAKSQSNDNPVYYIQYAHARICSVFRQLEQRKWHWQAEFNSEKLKILTAEQEQQLCRCLARYPEVIEAAAKTYEPSVVAHYLQELAHYFHSYYNAYPFLTEESELRNARLSLIAAIRQVIWNGLTLLGLSAPEIM